MGKDPIEEGKGRLKEAAGSLTGSDSLKREGKAQQDKTEAQERAAGKREEAAREDERARAARSEQKTYE